MDELQITAENAASEDLPKILNWRRNTEEVSRLLKLRHEQLSPIGAFKNYLDLIDFPRNTAYNIIKSKNNTIGVPFGTPPHVSNNSGENEWYTPLRIIDLAKNTMGKIDLDPASCETANRNVNADKYYTIDDDGLDKDWLGNIWLNPPYSREEVVSFSNAVLSKIGEFNQACVLVNNATETDWFQNLLKACNAVCFIKGRVRYLDKNNQPKNSPIQGQAVLYFGENKAEFFNNFNEIGTCLTAGKI